MSRARKSLILFAVSVLPHLYGISSPLLDYHYHRQANTADIAKNFHEDGLPFLHPRIDWDGNNRATAATEFPLYMWLVGLFWGLFGLAELWGRVLSTVFSGLTAVVLCRFLEGWLEEDAAFWGALLFCFLPIEVYFGRTVQPESLSLLLYAAALRAFDRCLLSKSGCWAWWLAAAAGAGLAVGHKIPYAHVWLILGAMAFARRGRAALRDPRLWLFFPVSAAPAAAWYHYTSRIKDLQVLPTSTGGIAHLLNYTSEPRLLLYYSFYQLFSRFPEITATYAGLAFFGAGAWAFCRRKIWFPIAWWLSVALYVIACGGYTFIHEYTALPFALANAAFLGEGFAVLRSKVPKALLAALLLGIPVHAALRIKHWYNLNFAYLLRVKPIIAGLSGPDDLFFCNNRASSVPLFYIGRRGWAWDVKELGERNLGLFDALTRKGAKFFLTENDLIFRSKTDPVARHFFDNFPVVYRDEEVLIFRLKPLPEPKTS